HLCLHLHWARPRRNLPHNLRRHPARAQKARLDAASPPLHVRLYVHLHWTRPPRNLPHNLRRYPAQTQKV
ncbi:unnamed protein product, partial [Ectocarpus fasciculatus]